MSKTHEQILSQVPLFADLNASQRKLLFESASIETFERGETLFLAGEPAESFLVVLEGQVKVYLLSPDGREHILHLAGTGDLVAEGAVFAQRTYPANAMAVEVTTVAQFFRERLVTIIKQDPELALAMIAGMSRRLREFVTTIEDLSLRDVTARLARYLTENAVGGFCKLPGTKTQLAASLGTVLEPLSRSFRKLKTEEFIKEHKQGVVIIDEIALRSLYE